MSSVFAFLLALVPGVFLVSLFLLAAYAVKGQVTMIYDGSYQAAAHYATLGGLLLLALLAVAGFAGGALTGTVGLLVVAALVVYAVAFGMSKAKRRDLAGQVGAQVALVGLQIIGFALLVVVVASRTGAAA
jgi:hypothetical protein